MIKTCLLPSTKNVGNQIGMAVGGARANYFFRLDDDGTGDRMIRGSRTKNAFNNER